MDREELLNDNETAQRVILDGRQAQIWTTFPAIVTAVNWGHMTVDCQPAIQGIVQDGKGNETFVNLPVLLDCPLVFPSAGGFIITLPIAVDDEVLISVASRCIDAWWQSGGIQKPIESRMHDLSDGFAIPGPRSLPNTVEGISTTGCQIRNDAGTTYVEISGDGKIKLVSPSEVDITTPLVKVTGNMTVSGTITAVGEITSGAIPLTLHIHGGVTAGGGNTGPALP